MFKCVQGAQFKPFFLPPRNHCGSSCTYGLSACTSAWTTHTLMLTHLLANTHSQAHLPSHSHTIPHTHTRFHYTYSHTSCHPFTTTITTPLPTRTCTDAPRMSCTSALSVSVPPLATCLPWGCVRCCRELSQCDLPWLPLWPAWLASE